MKVIRHAHHDQILRLSNADAQTLVGTGRWVFVSKLEHLKVPGRRHRPWLIGAALAFTALAVLLWAGAAKAADKPVPIKICLTREQAIEVFKTLNVESFKLGNDTCWRKKR